MTNDWLIDVLADLRAFAHKNDYVDLAAQLDRTSQIAWSELLEQENGTRQREAGAWAEWNAAAARRHH
ncbi:hypothetical protein LCGC14_2013280 [marine sediment metagenome]|uniref:Uncharacterized protein n=1 Tax=marine sediment metagenome TaxID=412755 RepID=A0A0F9FM49_9ZZZZ